MLRPVQQTDERELSILNDSVRMSWKEETSLSSVDLSDLLRPVAELMLHNTAGTCDAKTSQSFYSLSWQLLLPLTPLAKMRKGWKPNSHMSG
jgi:hypothetical protein